MEDILEYIADNRSKQSRYEIDLALLKDGYWAEDIDKAWQEVDDWILSIKSPIKIPYFLEIVIIQIPRNFLIYLACHLAYICFWLLLSWCIFSDLWLKIVCTFILFGLYKNFKPKLINLGYKKFSLPLVKRTTVRIIGIALIGFLLFLQGTLADIESYFPGFANSSKIVNNVAYGDSIYSTEICRVGMCDNELSKNCQSAEASRNLELVQRGWVINSTGLPYRLLISNKWVGYKYIVVQYSDNCIVSYISGGIG